MTEHEMLKEICDLIEYESWYWDTIRRWYIYKWEEELDVREIIFTQEFKEAFTKKLYWKIDDYLLSVSDYNEIIEHLNDPVQYLYNILWLWK